METNIITILCSFLARMLHMNAPLPRMLKCLQREKKKTKY